ncbi:MAG TPA: S53 family serine peptidase [Stellaceae bacterium]|nr:S53 family serine peptidase [Stellaceae bacterium]
MVFLRSQFGAIAATVLLASAASSSFAANLHGAADIGAARATDSVSFEVVLPQRDPDGLARLLEAQHDPDTPDFERWLSPAERQARFGPDEAAVARVRTVLAREGFTAEPDALGLHATGRADTASRLFGVALRHVVDARGHDRIVASEGLSLPAALAAENAHVIGFDPFIRMHALARRAAVPQNRTSVVGPYWAADLKQAYHAVSAQVATGAGRTIAILMDADVSDADMTSYFQKDGMPPPSSIQRIEIDGGAGFDPNGDSLETTLDVQQSFGMAPGATIVIYVLKDLSDKSIMDGLNQAISDNLADVVSMSFGICEKVYTAAYNDGTDMTGTLTDYTTLFANGNAQGMTFVASSGDYGALQCPPAAYFAGGGGSYVFHAGASSPATDPNVTGVGGTNLLTDFVPGSFDSTYARENARDDPLEPFDPYGLGVNVSGGVWGSGGGPSIFFPAPSWQSRVTTGTTMRATPDLSLHMGGCPSIAVPGCLSKARSADWEYLDGQKIGVLGTSAAAPNFAGVLALMEQYTGKRLGNVNPMIYHLAHVQRAGGVASYRQDIAGTNGIYTSNADASAPYNMVIGNGTVKIDNFIGAHGQPRAGVPGTRSNP